MKPSEISLACMVMYACMPPFVWVTYFPYFDLLVFSKATGKPLQIDAFPVAGSLIHLARRWSPAPSAT